jgi:hypothetical protein
MSKIYRVLWNRKPWKVMGLCNIVTLCSKSGIVHVMLQSITMNRRSFTLKQEGLYCRQNKKYRPLQETVFILSLYSVDYWNDFLFLRPNDSRRSATSWEGIIIRASRYGWDLILSRTQTKWSSCSCSHKDLPIEEWWWKPNARPFYSVDDCSPHSRDFFVQLFPAVQAIDHVGFAQTRTSLTL